MRKIAWPAIGKTLKTAKAINGNYSTTLRQSKESLIDRVSTRVAR
jgi:hypothetical protein